MSSHIFASLVLYLLYRRHGGPEEEAQELCQVVGTLVVETREGVNINLEDVKSFKKHQSLFIAHLNLTHLHPVPMLQLHQEALACHAVPVVVYVILVIHSPNLDRVK